MEKQRDTLIDLLKGIGIISIVIGHSSWILPGIGFPMGPFVYTYHIMIFFFVAGMCFKPRWDLTPYMQIGKRLGGLLPIYIKYSVIFILLHNFFLKIHILKSDTAVFSKKDIISAIFNACVLRTSESMLGAFWFIPMFFIGMSMFMLLFYSVDKLKCSKFGHVLICIGTAVIGIILNYKGIGLQYHMQTSVLGIPVIYLGYLFQRHRLQIQRYVHWWLTPVLGFVIWKVLSLNIGIVELSANMILHPLLFYPITVVGITFCICLANGIGKLKNVCKLFCAAGKNSYHIMALHFITFKGIDFVICKIWNIGNDVLERYPHSFENTWPICYIGGVVIPLLIVYTGNYIWRKIKSIFSFEKFLKES